MFCVFDMFMLFISCVNLSFCKFSCCEINKEKGREGEQREGGGAGRTLMFILSRLLDS